MQQKLLALQEQRVPRYTPAKHKLCLSLHVLFATVTNHHRKSTTFKVCFAFFTCTQSLTMAKPTLWAQSARLLALSVGIFCYLSSRCLSYLCDGRQCCDRWLSFLETLPLFALFICPCILKSIRPLAALGFASSAIWPELPKLGLPLRAAWSAARRVKLEGYF